MTDKGTVTMIVLCAWCEQEGLQALMYETEAREHISPSHGICTTHQKVLLKQIQGLRRQDGLDRMADVRPLLKTTRPRTRTHASQLPLYL